MHFQPHNFSTFSSHQQRQIMHNYRISDDSCGNVFQMKNNYHEQVGEEEMHEEDEKYSHFRNAL